jgi:hypothetical protein
VRKFAVNIGHLLLSAAAALLAVSGARAADTVVVAEPEVVEYVKICDAYGAGTWADAALILNSFGLMPLPS